MSDPKPIGGFINVSDQFRKPQDKEVNQDGFVNISDMFQPAQKKDTGIGEAAKKGFLSGLTDIAGAVNTGVEWAGHRLSDKEDNPISRVGKEGREFWEKKGEPYQAPEDIQGDILENPELLKNPSWWVYNVVNTGTSMIPGMVAGAGVGGVATKGIQVLGKAYQWSPKIVSNLQKLAFLAPAGVVGGGQEGVQTYKEVLDKTGDEQSAARAMEAMTTASGVLNALSFGKMFKVLNPKEKAGILNYARHVIEGGATESITEYLEDPTEVLIKLGVMPEHMSKKEIVAQLKSGVNVIPAAFATGGMGSVVGARYKNQELRDKQVTDIKTPEQPKQTPQPDVPDFQPTDTTVIRPDSISALKKDMAAVTFERFKQMFFPER